MWNPNSVFAATRHAPGKVWRRACPAQSNPAKFVGKVCRMGRMSTDALTYTRILMPPSNHPIPSSSSPDLWSARANAAKSAVVDAAGLEVKLRRHVRGDVCFDQGSRALYATDGSNYRQVPIGVVLPRDAGDVLATLSLAREYGAPILCRGTGTSLAGQCCNVAVVLDFSKYMARILEVDPVRRIAWRPARSRARRSAQCG